jgi:hypothetical protein
MSAYVKYTSENGQCPAFSVLICKDACQLQRSGKRGDYNHVTCKPPWRGVQKQNKFTFTIQEHCFLVHDGSCLYVDSIT